MQCRHSFLVKFGKVAILLDLALQTHALIETAHWDNPLHSPLYAPLKVLALTMVNSRGLFSVKPPSRRHGIHNAPRHWLAGPLGNAMAIPSIVNGVFFVED